jgi:hypothetical protein
MSQNSNIITYLKRFSDDMFPVARQQERITFQRNVETLFDTNDLMGIGTDTPTPPLGSLVFWEDAGGAQHCGIAVAHNGFKIYSITQQKGLTQMPQGVRAMEARELLEAGGVSQVVTMASNFYIVPVKGGDGPAGSHHKDIFRILEKITEDTLKLNPSDGQVTIEKESHPIKKKRGTQLVRSLIKGFKRLDVQGVKDKPYSYIYKILWKSPDSPALNIDLDDDINAFTKAFNGGLAKNGTGSSATTFIRSTYEGGKPYVLGHELVHAMRIMLGRRWEEIPAGTTSQEEIEGMIAENTLAKEMGFTERTIPGNLPSLDTNFWNDFIPL